MRRIDTHAAYKELVQSGAQEKLAESIIRLVDNARTTELENLVTKQDLSNQTNLLKTEFKADISELRTEFKADISELKAEFKADISELRTEFKTDILELKTELKADISDSKRDSKLQLDIALSKIDSNFKIIFIVGGLVSAILVTPILTSWFGPILNRLTHQ